MNSAGSCEFGKERKWEDLRYFLGAARINMLKLHQLIKSGGEEHA